MEGGGGLEQDDLVPDDFTRPHFLKSLNTYKMLKLNLLFLKPVVFFLLLIQVTWPRSVTGINLKAGT